MDQQPLFRSFWQAGFECSTHRLKTGKRLDLVAATHHDRLVNEDFARIADLGIRTAREGIRWHLIEWVPGRYDFSSVVSIVEASQRHGIQIIWDMCHFGWPDYLDVFQPQWRMAFTELANAFGRFLKANMSQTAFVAPINEISFLSWAGGDTAYLNPFAVNRGNELKQQLVRGAAEASGALLSELRDVRLVSPEPVIHICGDPNRPGDVLQAAEYESSMFEVWDMLSGRVHPELGGRSEYLDIIGLNYYDHNQWWNYGETIWRGDPAYRPFREIIDEVHRRYSRPLFISETGTEDEGRPDWLRYIATESRAAQMAGVPVKGICLYPILNHPGWDDDRHCYNGLWDYARPDGTRDIDEPLATELQYQIHTQSEHYETSSQPRHQARPNLSVPPAVEFCLPASSASDEQVCAHSPGLLC